MTQATKLIPTCTPSYILIADTEHGISEMEYMPQIFHFLA